MTNKIINATGVFCAVCMFLLFYSCSQKRDEKPVQASTSYSIQVSSIVSNFYADSAYRHIEKQVSFGPRVPGTAAHDKAFNYITSYARQFSSSIQIQEFSYPGYDNATLALKNIIIKINPNNKNRVLLCAHWDSRPYADASEDTTEHAYAVPGANDGASGVGVMLELLRSLDAKSLKCGIDLVFFDGEDYGKSHDLSLFCLGSKYFASSKGDYQPAFGILLDMVGDAGAKFNIEENSQRSAEDVTGMIWRIAEMRKYPAFVNEGKYSIYDDHVPLIQSGIRTVDIIDAELVGYKDKSNRRAYWHTRNDTMKNISRETIQQVGNTLYFLFNFLEFSS